MHIFFQNCDILDFKDCFCEKLYLTCVAIDNKRIYQQTILQIELYLLLQFEIFGSFHKYLCAHRERERERKHGRTSHSITVNLLLTLTLKLFMYLLATIYFRNLIYSLFPFLLLLFIWKNSISCIGTFLYILNITLSS